MHCCAVASFVQQPPPARQDTPCNPGVGESAGWQAGASALDAEGGPSMLCCGHMLHSSCLTNHRSAVLPGCHMCAPPPYPHPAPPYPLHPHVCSPLPPHLPPSPILALHDLDCQTRHSSGQPARGCVASPCVVTFISANSGVLISAYQGCSIWKPKQAEIWRMVISPVNLSEMLLHLLFL